MNEQHSKNKHSQELPPLEIIDLDDNNSPDLDAHQIITEDEEPETYEETFFDKYLAHINLHLILLAVVVLSVIFIIVRFSSWGVKIKNDFDPNNLGDYEPDVLDNILPLVTDTQLPDDGVRTVLALGNSPFADDKGSDGNLASLIEDLSDCTVINCAVADSYLAASQPTFNASSDPMDAFNLYWLSTLMTMDNTAIYEDALNVMGTSAPADAVDAYKTLSTLDFDTVDVITIMYDAGDYLDGRKLINHENHSDIQTFYGNLNASLDLLQDAFPHIRFIIMSPTFAYAVAEDGSYISGDLHIYEEYALSYYAVMQEDSANSRVMTFLDNFYGTVSERNADEYLKDNVHLNDAGRQKLAERFVYALEYYDE